MAYKVRFPWMLSVHLPFLLFDVGIWMWDYQRNGYKHGLLLYFWRRGEVIEGQIAYRWWLDWTTFTSKEELLDRETR